MTGLLLGAILLLPLGPLAVRADARTAEPAATSARVSAPGQLQAGMARVDLTPDDPSSVTNLWGTRFTDVHDHIYARALVVAQDGRTAAIVSVDTPEISDGDPLRHAIHAATGIAVADIILVPSVDHNAPMIGARNATGSHSVDAGGEAYIKVATQKIVEAVKTAQAGLQPARMGMGTGTVDININRDQLTASGYIMGQNPKGPSDKTLSVVRFDTLSGRPIGLLFNYAVHGGSIGSGNTHLTGDFPGAAERYVEAHYGEGVVAMVSVGAEGDQDPVLISEHATNPQGGTPEDGDEHAFAVADVLGQILGQGVVRVADATRTTITDAPITSVTGSVTCEGQTIVGTGTGDPIPADQVQVTHSGNVEVPLGVLRIGKIALPWIPGEPVTQLGADLGQGSPYPDTVFLTLANGRIGYISDKAGFAAWTQEALGSTVAEGCGEALIDKLVAMLWQP